MRAYWIGFGALAVLMALLMPGCPLGWQKPTAAFLADPESGPAPLLVAFTDWSLPGSGGISQWWWDFGTGDAATVRNPVYVYTVPGTYSVSLEVAGAHGKSREMKKHYILVTDGGGEGEGEGEPPTEMVLRRTFPGGATYTPGQFLDITLSLEYRGENPVLALGVIETLPAGWTYHSVGGGKRPDVIQFVPGPPAILELAWVNTPAFPIVFTYRVTVPAGETGPKEISGHAIYRTLGPQRESNEEISVVSP